MANEQVLNTALALLAVSGDGALSGADACVAKAILQAPSPSDKQIEALKKIIARYKIPDSLPDFYKEGVDRDLPAPPRVDAVRFVPVDTKYGPMIAVRFPYSPKLVDMMKTVRGRQADMDGKLSGIPKTWLIPARGEDLKAAVALFRGGQTKYPVEVDIFVDKLIEKGEEAYKESRAESADITLPTKIKLYPFQQAGVKWIDDHNGRALVADEPGLGKTSQALGYLVLRPQKALPALVLCPATLRVNWMRETEKFTDLKCLVISGSTSIAAFRKLKIPVSDRPMPGHDLTIINYDLLSVETPETWVKMLLKDDLEKRKYAHKELVQAGRQALELIQKKMEDFADIESRNRLHKVYAEIDELGKEARSLRDKKYMRVFVNNLPLEEFLMAGFKTLVADECHYTKEAASQRAQATLAIAETMESCIGLTGTPILNRTKDLWSQVQIINRTLYPKFFDYGMEFCNGHKKQAGKRMVWDFSGSSNLDKLEHQLRSSVMIRRTKIQVLKELPEKTRVMIPFVIEDKEEKKYRKETEPVLDRLAKLRKEREEWKILMASMSDAERKAYVSKHAEDAAKAGRLTNMIVEDIEKVKQAAVNAKLGQAIKFVLNVHEQQGKILVFASHHSTIDQLAKAFRDEGVKVGVIDGRVAGPARAPIVDGFQNGDIDILVCGIRAASEGLTLTSSHTVVTVELDWNFARHTQAEDRTHRFGQKMAVTVYYLVVMGSIEEKIAKMIDAKRELVNAALGEGGTTLSEDGIMDSVLDSIFEEGN